MSEPSGFTFSPRWNLLYKRRKKQLVAGTLVCLTVLYLLFSNLATFIINANALQNWDKGWAFQPGRNICVQCLTSRLESISRGIPYLQSTATFSPKVNTAGTYLPFLGYSVVAMREDKQSFSKNIRAMLENTTLLKYYISCLPEESYHVTIYDVFHHRSAFHTRPRWLPLPPDVFLPMEGDILNAMITGDKTCDTSSHKFSASLGTLGKNWSLGDAFAINVKIVKDDWTVELRKRLSELFGYTGFAKYIQNIMYDQIYPDPRFHVTLGYFIRPFPLDPDIQREFLQQVRTIERAISGKTLLFKKPQLSVFHDMTCFSPFKEFMYKCYNKGRWRFEPASVFFNFLAVKSFQHIESWTKWPSFSKRYFQIHFCNRKCLYVGYNFIEIFKFMGRLPDT